MPETNPPRFQFSLKQLGASITFFAFAAAALALGRHTTLRFDRAFPYFLFAVSPAVFAGLGFAVLAPRPRHLFAIGCFTLAAAVALVTYFPPRNASTLSGYFDLGLLFFVGAPILIGLFVGIGWAALRAQSPLGAIAVAMFFTVLGASASYLILGMIAIGPP